MAKKAEIQEAESAPEERISFDQYCDRFRSDLHRYTRAFVEARVRGTINTKGGWDAIVEQHLGGNAT
jgi:hypothetical protein